MLALLWFASAAGEVKRADGKHPFIDLDGKMRTVGGRRAVLVGARRCIDDRFQAPPQVCQTS